VRQGQDLPGQARPALHQRRSAGRQRRAGEHRRREDRRLDEAALRGAVTLAGYPQQADLQQINKPMIVALIVALIIISAMCYGPLAALMVELFPTRIRYTSMSLPYHIGNGWFGGFLPTVSFALVVYTGDIFYGLWYPVLITGVSLVVGMICLRERISIWTRTESEPEHMILW
jgi:hypothetical protein